MVAYPDRLCDSGVVTTSTAAPAVGNGGNLWFNPTTGALSVSQNGAWVPVTPVTSGTSSSDEVLVGATQPAAGSGIEIWVDTNGLIPTMKVQQGTNWVSIINGGTF